MIHPIGSVDPKAAHRPGRQPSGRNCYVGPDVVLGDGCVLHNNVTITGNTICGRQTSSSPARSSGDPAAGPQVQGRPTRVEIGDDNVFRELVTVHAGTEVAGGVTRIGSHNRFLVGVHIAHDVRIGNDCILSNYVQLAGHVCLEDKVTMGGIIGVHHFTTIGTLAYIGGLTRIIADVPPYMIVEGNPARVRGLQRDRHEALGLRRRADPRRPRGLPGPVQPARPDRRRLHARAAGRDRGRDGPERRGALPVRVDPAQHQRTASTAATSSGIAGTRTPTGRRSTDRRQQDGGSQVMQPIPVAVVGTGHMGRHHARIYHELPDSELVGVVDVDAERAAEMAAKFNTQAYPSIEPLLGKVEAVTIAVPTVAHLGGGPAVPRGRHRRADREAPRPGRRLGPGPAASSPASTTRCCRSGTPSGSTRSCGRWTA